MYIKLAADKVTIDSTTTVDAVTNKIKKKTFNKILRLINSLKNEFKKQIYSSNQLHNSEVKLICFIKKWKNYFNS